MLIIKLLPIIVVISLQLSACQLISCSTDIYCGIGTGSYPVTRHCALVINKLLFKRNKCAYLYLLYMLCLVCVMQAMKLCMGLCVIMCVSNGLCASAVLLMYLHYNEEWVEVRHMLFLDQQSFLLVNVYVEIFPPSESRSFST